jgi:hypothetical protein
MVRAAGSAHRSAGAEAATPYRAPMTDDELEAAVAARFRAPRGPAPDDVAWRDRLRERVDAVDAVRERHLGAARTSW